MAGVATEIMVVSRDMRVVPSIRDAIITTSLKPVGYCDSALSRLADFIVSATVAVLLVISTSFCMIYKTGGFRGMEENVERAMGDEAATNKRRAQSIGARHESHVP